MFHFQTLLLTESAHREGAKEGWSERGAEKKGWTFKMEWRSSERERERDIDRERVRESSLLIESAVALPAVTSVRNDLFQRLFEVSKEEWGIKSVPLCMVYPHTHIHTHSTFTL